MSGCTGFVRLPTDTEDTEAPPGVYLTPDDLSFRAPMDESDVKSVVVWNNTSSSVTLTHNDLDGEDADAFDVIAPVSTFLTLSPQQLSEVAVSFTPTRAGYHYATLPIQGDGVELEVQLTALGQAPVATITTEQAPDTTVGCQSEATVTITNAGDAPLELVLEEVVLDDFTLVDALPDSVAAGESTAVELLFEPTDEGTHLATFSFTTNVPDDDSLVSFVRGDGVAVEVHTETIHYNAGSGVDLLIAMDDDGLTSFASLVYTGIDDWLQAHLDRGVDYRVSGVETETGCPAVDGIWASDSDDLEDARDVVRDALFDEGQGIYGDALMTVARMALQNTEGSGCLAGFLREDVPLHVLLVSDRDEASAKGWAYELETMQGLEPDGVVVSAIMPLTGCAAAPEGYGDAAEATDGLTLDMCEPTWSDHFERLADLSAELEVGDTSVVLEVEPDPDSIVVTLDGEPTTDWTLAEGTLELTLDVAPDEGTEVVVQYLPLEPCAEDTD